MAISKESIEQLRDVADVLDVVSDRVVMKKAGSTWKGLCPFHKEKTPSFTVSPERGSFHCFGCKAGGDVYKFVEMTENVSFVEAVEIVADRYNFTLEKTGGDGGQAKETGRVLDIVQGYYVEQLREEDRKYLRSRGLKAKTVRDWGIGYAPRSREQMEWLKGQHLPMDVLTSVGLVRSGDRGVYAHFSDRVMFAIRDHRGRTVGWSGRSLRKDAKAKYLNSIDSPVFDKSRVLFGWDRARKMVYGRKAVIVMEGQLDVILSQQEGISTAVGVQGTALTTKHLPLFARASARVILCYDGDSAGQAAMMKAAEMVTTHKLSGGVVILPEGDDPAAMIQEGRGDVLKALLMRPEDMVRYVLRGIAAGYRLDDPRQKSAAAEAMRAYLGNLGDPIVTAEYLPVASAMIGVDTAMLARGSAAAVTPPSPPTAQSRVPDAEAVLLLSLRDHPEWVDVAVDMTEDEAWEDAVRYRALLESAPDRVDWSAIEAAVPAEAIIDDLKVLEGALRLKDSWYKRRVV